MSFAQNLKAGGGGGYLNGVDVLWRRAEFTTCPPRSTVPSKLVYLVPTLHEEAKGQDTTTHMLLGGTERYRISEDKQSVTGVSAGPVEVSQGSAVGVFVASLLKAGFSDDKLPRIVEGDPLEFSCLVGQRFHVIRTKNLTAKTQRIDKNTGIAYDRTHTVVSAILEPAEGAASVSRGNGSAGTDTGTVVFETEKLLRTLLINTPGGSLGRIDAQKAIASMPGLLHAQRAQAMKDIQSPLFLDRLQELQLDDTGALFLPDHALANIPF